MTDRAGVPPRCARAFIDSDRPGVLTCTAERGHPGPHSDDRHGPEVLCCNGDPACDKPRVPNSLWCADHQPIPLCDRCNHKATSHWTGNDFDDCNELSCACRQFIRPGSTGG